MLQAAVLRAAVLQAAVLRAAVLQAVVLMAVVLMAVVLMAVVLCSWLARGCCLSVAEGCCKLALFLLEIKVLTRTKSYSFKFISRSVLVLSDNI